MTLITFNKSLELIQCQVLKQNKKQTSNISSMMLLGNNFFFSKKKIKNGKKTKLL